MNPEDAKCPICSKQVAIHDGNIKNDDSDHSHVIGRYIIYYDLWFIDEEYVPTTGVYTSDMHFEIKGLKFLDEERIEMLMLLR